MKVGSLWALAALAACGGASSQPAATPVTPASSQSAQAAATPQPLALVVVLEAQEVFIGNKGLEPDPAAQYSGHLDEIASAMPPLASLPGQAALVRYSIGAKVTHPFGPLSAVGASWLGTQKDYFHSIGTDLMVGLAEAAKLVHAAPVGSRRVILVIGDGCDTNWEKARADLPGLLDQLKDVELFDVRLLVPELSLPECDLLAQHSHRVGLADLATALRAAEHTP